MSSVKGIAVADLKRPGGQVDVAGGRRIFAKGDEDRVPIASGHRGGLIVLLAKDIEVVMRALKVDAACRGRSREARGGDED